MDPIILSGFDSFDEKDKVGSKLLCLFVEELLRFFKKKYAPAYQCLHNG